MTESENVAMLDHGFVRLIAHMGGDISVVRAARVSYDASWRAGVDKGSDDRLIQYLWRNAHTSPFEAVTFTFEVKAPIFVLRQWMRHRTWAYNELSARYQEMPEEFYVPAPDVVGEQSTDNRQGRQSTEADRITDVDIYEHACRDMVGLYKAFLSRGWPRELARAILPVATYSRMFATVNLLNLFRFLTLRCDERAQWEIRVYANAMRELIRPIVPTCVAAWENLTSHE